MLNPLDPAARPHSPTRSSEPATPIGPSSSPSPGPMAPPAGELAGLALAERRTPAAGNAMAPRAGLPGARLQAETAAMATAATTHTEELSLRNAKQQMEARLQTLSARHSVIGLATTPEQQQDAYEHLIGALRDAFALYDSLPRRTALRTLPDGELRNLRNEAVMANDLISDVTAPIRKTKSDKLVKDMNLLTRMSALNATRDVPLGLRSLYERVAQGRAEQIAYWDRRADQAVKMFGIVDVTFRLPNVPPQVRAKDNALRREYASHAVASRFTELQLRVSDASHEVQFAALDALDTQRAPEAIGVEDLVRQLDVFKDDIFPAFKSTRQALDVEAVKDGKPLTKDTVAVLDGVLGRLAEFAGFLDDVVATLRTTEDPVSVRLSQLLDKIVEGTWLTANEVTRTLQTFAHEDAAPPPRAEAPAATAAPAQRPDKRAKGKRKPAPGASSRSEQARPAPAPVVTAMPAAPTAPAKVLVRSELGTQRLADAGEAAASSSNAAAQAWQQPLSRLDLQQQLNRLDEMLAFDLAGQQRAVSQARRVQDPEAARFITEKTVSRLNARAAEMAACVQALDGNRKLLGLQLLAVHDKLRGLQVLMADVRGQARALHENLEGAQADHLKTYRFPTQAHIESLLGQGQLAKGALQALKGDPGTLFELKLQPSALRNGKLPQPIWLHIHTREPVRVDQLATLDKAAFGATHLKSDEERGRNRQWQDAQARAGHENALVYRGKISLELCRQLVG